MKQSLGRGLEQKLRNIPSTSTEDGIIFMSFLQHILCWREDTRLNYFTNGNFLKKSLHMEISYDIVEKLNKNHVC